MGETPLERLPSLARAVADAPAEALAARADELARRWALALLGARPLPEMVAVPLEELARHAPALIASLARALCSDRELAELAADRGAGDPGAAGDGALALDALAAGWSAPEAVVQIEALRGVLWRATLEELRDPTARQVADLADRLASVCAALLGRGLAAPAATGHQAPRAGRPQTREQVLYSAPGAGPGELGAVLIDERDQDWRVTRTQDERRGREQTASAAGAELAAQARPSASARRHEPTSAPRPLPWDTPLQSSPPPGVGEGPTPASEDPAMRVSRGPGAAADGRS